ncbi:putative transposase [Wenxinia saemankumensis]|uniref:Putative transposase n=1 Tax=Wenxinia saemankumensis TaxID=1447782 RepID=A0A1M6HNF8_9RHOB|nr:putative transposase [Wenxinia saemankumensis]
MKRSKFTKDQIIVSLRRAPPELCRRHDISSATFYALKAKFGGMDVSDAKRLRALEEENGRLKRLLAESLLDQAALKDLLGLAPYAEAGNRHLPAPVSARGV